MFLTLILFLVVSLAINIALFLIAYIRQSDKLTDASYALTFILLAYLGFTISSGKIYDIVGFSLVLLWGLRIGGFLLYRVIKVGKDLRFDGIRENFFLFSKFWVGQAITAWVLMVPLTLAFNSTYSGKNIAFLGVLLWLIGFVVESIADLQKYTFTRNAANKDKWIESGIWRYSRHPNYFGEILIWCGIYVYALPRLSTLESIVGLISPIVIALLLIFVTGIPILEKSADKRWGKLPAYQAYKKRTSILVPLPRKG